MAGSAGQYRGTGFVACGLLYLLLSPIPTFVYIFDLTRRNGVLRPVLRAQYARPLLVVQFRPTRPPVHGPAEERQFFGVGLLVAQRAVCVLPHTAVAKVGDKAVGVGVVQIAVLFIKCLYLLLAPRAVVVRPPAVVAQEAGGL